MHLIPFQYSEVVVHTLLTEIYLWLFQDSICLSTWVAHGSYGKYWVDFCYLFITIWDVDKDYISSERWGLPANFGNLPGHWWATRWNRLGCQWSPRCCSGYWWTRPGVHRNNSRLHIEAPLCLEVHHIHAHRGINEFLLDDFLEVGNRCESEHWNVDGLLLGTANLDVRCNVDELLLRHLGVKYFRRDFSVQGLLPRNRVASTSHGLPIYSVRKDSEGVIICSNVLTFEKSWPNSWGWTGRRNYWRTIKLR